VLYFLILRLSKRLSLSLTLDLEHLSERKERRIDQSVASFGLLPHQPAMVDLPRLLIDQAEDRA
jgi:hypothetical protein